MREITDGLLSAFSAVLSARTGDRWAAGRPVAPTPTGVTRGRSLAIIAVSGRELTHHATQALNSTLTGLALIVALLVVATTHSQAREVCC